MNISQIITLIVAILLIGFILWWFFGKHEESVENANVNQGIQEANIVVKGGYSPSTVVLKQGVPAKINFDMKDSTACLSHVVFEQLGVDKDLTKQKVTTIDIPTDKKGTYNFACGMDMFHGYKPDTVTFKVGKPAQLKFIPSDNMGCMNEVVSRDLNFDEKLDGKKDVTIDIPTDKPGTYNYACGMDMFHGKVVVK